MNREEYDAIDALNWSRLSKLARSPAHYAHWERRDSPALQGGRIVHMAVFEPQRFAEDVVVYPGKVRRGKEWEAYEAENHHREIVTEDEKREALAIADAVRSHPWARRMLAEGEGEKTIQWTHPLAGPCKARLDWVAPRAIVDLKRTRDASPDGFARESAKYKSHVQASWYADAYEAATGKQLPYFILAVEPEPPFVVQVYEVTQPLLNVGRREYDSLIQLLVACRETGRWTGYAEDVLPLTLPAYATGGVQL